MSVESIKKDITNTEQSILDNLRLLDEIRLNLTEAIKPFIKEKLKSLVEEEVKIQPEHTKSLPAEDLKEMKRKLIDLVNNSDNLINDKFANDDLWTHINYEFDEKNDFSKQLKLRRDAEDKFFLAFHELLGNAGKLLSNYKYIKIGDSNCNRSKAWEYISGSGGEVKYRYHFEMGKVISDLLKRYSALFDNVQEDMKAKLNLQKKLSEQEATDLWDQI